AERQTAGQGRPGRCWHSEKESGLYCSIVLRLPLPAEHLPVVTMAAGLAAADAITAITGLACDLRWPNDVLLQEKKACGILVQQHNDALVCGIGINVNHSVFPDELAPIAISLRMAAGRELSREHLLLELLAALDRHLDILVRQGREAVIRLFAQASSYAAGRRVVVEQGDTMLRGVTDGLDDNGFLYLRLDNGSRTLILAGGVRPA
ncbi:MAG: biotin--[acetyl-CoA-carboxylase] ligase, partial [Acidobacteria bacterium]|nr:biotin--[acetyl-CoA-carboxylase] ligase [Acidobacteriota bacterium]